MTSATPIKKKSTFKAPLAKEEKVESSFRTTCKYLCSYLYRLLTSTFGMVIMLVVYAFIGAAIFKLIEGTHENQQSKMVNKVAVDIIDNVWNCSLEVKKSEKAFKLLMKQELIKYEHQLRESIAQGVTWDTEIKVWDFWGSFFYATTIVTTIGYGHISPVTDLGRIVTMMYAVIGIPLCLITMADLGKLLTRGIKWLWSFIRRLYYTGRCLKARFIKAPVGEDGRETTVPLDEPYEIDSEFNLPVSLAIFVSIAYIFLGALIYCQWETWTYLEAFYFIFISVSTIGFGDVLPEHPKYFLASSIYVLMGLSLVAMVINVIMEDMDARLERAKGKMAEVSRTIGLSVEDDSSQASTNPATPASTPQSMRASSQNVTRTATS